MKLCFLGRQGSDVMIVGLDVDGIIRDFNGSLKRVYLREYPDHKVTDPTEWDLSKAYPIGKDINKFAFETYVNEIYLEADPYEGALDFVEDIARDYEIVIITSQPNYQAVYNSFEWLNKHGFNKYVSNHVFKDSSSKVFTKGHVRVDVLIDDYEENLKDAWEMGVFAVGIERSWNKGKWDPLFKNYHDLLQFLKRYEKVKEGKIEIPNLS